MSLAEMDAITRAKWNKWQEACTPKVVTYWVEINGETFGYDVAYHRDMDWDLGLDNVLEAAVNHHIAGGTIYDAHITSVLYPDGTYLNFEDD
jgi:hypothetical protein